MAYEADTPDNEENCAQDCDGPSIDPQYIADRERDLRMCCVRAALDLHRAGETTASAVVSEAQQILDFLNGSAK